MTIFMLVRTSKLACATVRLIHNSDLYGNDDYAAAEEEILGSKTSPLEKSDPPPGDATRSPPDNSASTKHSTPPVQPATYSAPRSVEPTPELGRQIPAAGPQIGNSIATYTSDEGTTLPSDYGSGYGSAPTPIRSYESQGERQSNSGANFSDPTQVSIQ